MADELIQAAGIFEGMNWWTSNNMNPVNKSFFSDPLPGYNCSLAGGEIGWSNHNDLMFGGNKAARCTGYYNEDDPLGYLTDVDNVIQKSDDHHQLQPNPVVGCGVVDESSVQDWSTTDQEAAVVTGETNYYFGSGNGNITDTGSVGGDSSNSTREANYYFCGGNGNGKITATGSAGGGGDSSNSSGEGSTITTSDHHYHHQGSGAGPAAGSTSFPMDDHSPSNLFQTLMNNEQLLINPPADPAAIININPVDNYQQMINSPCWSTEVGATNNNNKFSGKAAMLADSLEDIRASLFSSPSPSPSPRPLQSHHRQKRPAGFDGCDKPCRGDQRKEKGVNNKAASVSSSKTSSINVEPSIKRPRIETPSSLPTFKVRKEKLGDRITALQQLVSPFGKTDTASVLHEAIVYIKFLHDQVKVLSTSYMKNAAPVQHSNHQQGHNSKNQDEGRLNFDLRTRGLCLVPISSTFPVAHETPADFWTPTFGATFR